MNTILKRIGTTLAAFGLALAAIVAGISGTSAQPVGTAVTAIEASVDGTGESLSILQVQVEPGERFDADSHPGTAAMYVNSGRIALDNGDRAETMVEAGEVFRCEQSCRNDLTNVSDETAFLTLFLLSNDVVSSGNASPGSGPLTPDM